MINQKRGNSNAPSRLRFAHKNFGAGRIEEQLKESFLRQAELPAAISIRDNATIRRLH